jgi:hypothetical protein
MFHKEECMKFVSAGYMAADPKSRQEVFSDGDHISGNSLEPGGWSLVNDNGAYKPGRDWTHKSFFLNTVYESAHLHQMMKKCHEDFPKAPGTTSFLRTWRLCPTCPTLPGGRRMRRSGRRLSSTHRAVLDLHSQS